MAKKVAKTAKKKYQPLKLPLILETHPAIQLKKGSTKVVTGGDVRIDLHPLTLDDMVIGKRYSFTNKDDSFIGVITTKRDDPTRVLCKSEIRGGVQADIPMNAEDAEDYTISELTREEELNRLGAA